MMSGTAPRQMKLFLVYLLRLRQATFHPVLLEKMFREDFTADEIRKLRMNLSSTPESKLHHDNTRHLHQTVDPDDLTTVVPDVSLSQPAQDTSSDLPLMERYLKRLETRMILEMVQCKRCGEISKTPRRIIQVRL